MEIEIREFCCGSMADHHFEEVKDGQSWKEAAREYAEKTFSE